MQFIIYDMNDNIISIPPRIEAENAREAVQIHLGNRNEQCQFRRSGDRTARFGVQPITQQKGITFKSGRKTWFAEI